jgi:hypothetical protein
MQKPALFVSFDSLKLVKLWFPLPSKSSFFYLYALNLPKT